MQSKTVVTVAGMEQSPMTHISTRMSKCTLRLRKNSSLEQKYRTEITSTKIAVIIQPIKVEIRTVYVRTK